MAKIWIDNGINVDPTWTNHIAVSPDGVKWSTINKHSIDVAVRHVNGSITSRIINKTPVFRISLNRGEDVPKLDFDLQNVDNQPGWNTADGITGCLAAVADITTWLGSGGGGGPFATEATLAAVLAAVQDHQDFEVKLVKDNGAGGLIVCQRTEYDETTDTYSVSYVDATGAAYVLIGPAEFIEDTPKTPTKVVSTGVTVIPIGASEVSIFNNGGTAATTLSLTHPAGIGENYGYENPIDTAITTDGGGVNQMLITYMI